MTAIFKKITFLSLFVFVLFIFNKALALDTTNSVSIDKFIPSGVEVSAILAEELNSDNITVGQNVNCYLLQNFKYKNTLIAPKASLIKGNVVKNKKADDITNSSTLIRFTSITTPYNNVIPISAIVKTEDKTGILKGTQADKALILNAGDAIDISFVQPITVVAR